MYIGTVDLSALGESVKKARRKEKLTHIYVLGRSPEGFGSIDQSLDDNTGTIQESNEE
jgi:hypothetical protein